MKDMNWEEVLVYIKKALDKAYCEGYRAGYSEEVLKKKEDEQDAFEIIVSNITI